MGVPESAPAVQAEYPALRGLVFRSEAGDDMDPVAHDPGQTQACDEGEAFTLLECVFGVGLPFGQRGLGLTDVLPSCQDVLQDQVGRHMDTGREVGMLREEIAVDEIAEGTVLPSGVCIVPEKGFGLMP